jgi:hypothetical protein
LLQEEVLTGYTYKQATLKSHDIVNYDLKATVFHVKQFFNFLTARCFPTSAVLDHCIKHNHELPHTGGNGNFMFLPGNQEPFIETFDFGIATNG